MQEVEGVKVYVQLDDESRITAINSSIFLSESKKATWQQIDVGMGKKYAHAQTLYLPKSLKDKYGLYNYQYVNGAIIEITDKAQEIDKIEKRGKIELLKEKLAQYDYIGVKIATGRATISDYATEIEQMKEWAQEINELEQDLNKP